MIGVVAQTSERDAVTEFFELFKTPWEFYRDDGKYEVVICTSAVQINERARLVIIFSGMRTTFDNGRAIPVASGEQEAVLKDRDRRIPIYATLATFSIGGPSLLKEERSGRTAAFVTQAWGKTVVRVGYNLFAETGFLLGAGQPARNAGIPTLELHIAMLRDWITCSGIPVIEIPPVPFGHNFIACLTHDIDHPVLRNHCCDHTMFGFLYRSTVASTIQTLRGRKPVKRLWSNWSAACRLPFVYCGVANDFWREFDRYLEMEAGQRSTYFVIPRKNYPGRNSRGLAPAKRACHYNLTELTPQLLRIGEAGCEVGLHGLDAWLDPVDGRNEGEQVRQVVGGGEMGVRMHWLFFDDKSPAALEEAGFSYDSTVGYRETVGYRAGTSQAYQFPGTCNLIELPLIIMDTALFYPAYLNLDETAAERRVWELVDQSERFGGALTINWHDRSIAPERLWGDFYLKLLGELLRRGAWCPTAAQAVAWFRKRRGAVLAVEMKDGNLGVKSRTRHSDNLPGLQLRVHKPSKLGLDPTLARKPAEFMDLQLENETELSIAI